MPVGLSNILIKQHTGKTYRDIDIVRLSTRNAKFARVSNDVHPLNASPVPASVQPPSGFATRCVSLPSESHRVLVATESYLHIVESSEL